MDKKATEIPAFCVFIVAQKVGPVDCEITEMLY